MDNYLLYTHIFGLPFLVLLYNLIMKKRNKGNSNNVGVVIKEHDECLDDEGRTDVIIVGAGVAGSALACTLAKDRRRVHMIERDLSEPDRMVGEFLQPGGYLKLLDLGLEDCVKDIDAQRVVGYAIYKNGGKHTMLSYPLDKFDANADVSAKSFHNGRFIQKMRNKAATFPNVRIEEGTVTCLIEEMGRVKGVNYKTKDGKELSAYAPLTIVCDGCYSNLRRSLSCNSKVDISSSFVGFTLRDCQLPCENRAALIMPDSSPVTLFYPINSTEIRCMVLLPAQKLPNQDMLNYLNTLVAPHVPDGMRDAFVRAAGDKGNIRITQIRSMAAENCQTKPGCLLIGDAFNMRHPITGGGMTVALSDIVVLRDLLRTLPNLNDANALSKSLQRFYTLRKPLASTINIVADVVSQVLCRPSLDPAIRKEIIETCYGYISLGGNFSNGAAATMSGLNPRPIFSMAFQFIAMGIYAAARLLSPFPTPNGVWRMAKLLYVTFGIIFPIMKAEGIRQMFFPAYCYI